MKKLALLLLILPLFFACGSDEETQDYTSFIVENKSSTVDLSNVIVGYLKNGNFIKIAAIGDLKANATSKEVTIDSKDIKGIYFFMDYLGTKKINKEFEIKQNIKNICILTGNDEVLAVSDKTDPTQYPQ